MKLHLSNVIEFLNFCNEFGIRGKLVIQNDRTDKIFRCYFRAIYLDIEFSVNEGDYLVEDNGKFYAVSDTKFDNEFLFIGETKDDSNQ